MPIAIKVSGDFALFTLPEAKVERASASVITPSAARNILDQICWRPEMRWVVTSIKVLKPIQFISIRRNELQSKISLGSVQRWMTNPDRFEPQVGGAGQGSDSTPRNSLILRDVSYVIEAFPLVYNLAGDNTPHKYESMLLRRVEKGQSYSQPYLGCREFDARIETSTGHETPIPVSLDLGRMLYDIVFSSAGHKPIFFSARLAEGVMNTRPDVVLRDHPDREELLKCSYRR